MFTEAVMSAASLTWPDAGCVRSSCSASSTSISRGYYLFALDIETFFVSTASHNSSLSAVSGLRADCGRLRGQALTVPTTHYLSWEDALYERFCLLATALKLPPWEGAALTGFLMELRRRVEAKAIRLQMLLPGISLATSRDAICRASVMLNWCRMEEALDRIESQQELEEQAWDLIDMLPACYEPSASDFPLAVLPRTSIRIFARRLEDALRLDAPHAYQLTAELFGARDWLSLAGKKPFLPIAEPLYRYRKGLGAGLEWAWLVPCEGARRVDEEFEAMTQLRKEIFQADLAQNEFVDQPGVLCAGSVGAALHLVDREYEIAEWKARSTLQAVEVDYPDDCRRPLAPGSKTHLFYIRLRAALFASLAHAGKTEEAHLERALLTARGKEYRADYERLLRQWAPRDAKPQHRTALHVVA